jgi:hypothetical protein
MGFTSIVPSFEVGAIEPAVCSTDLILRDVRRYAHFSHHLDEVPCVMRGRVQQHRSSRDPIQKNVILF